MQRHIPTVIAVLCSVLASLSRPAVAEERMAGLLLRIEPTNTHVTIDNKAVELIEQGRTAVARVQPGLHRVRVSKEKHVTMHRPLEVPAAGLEATVRLAPLLPEVEVTMKNGRVITGLLLERDGDDITITRGKGKMRLTKDMYVKVEVVGEAPWGKTTLEVVAKGKHDAGEDQGKLEEPPPGAALPEKRKPPKARRHRPKPPQRGLPLGFEKAFIARRKKMDQYGNPVVRRGRRKLRADRDTGLPYEIWLQTPQMEFVLIPAGEFSMGSTLAAKDIAAKYGGDPEWFTGEQPRHLVRITKPFYLAKYEVTQTQWQAVMTQRPWKTKGQVREKPRHPAVCVSWDDCQAFARRLSVLCGVEGFRLPTEAEWEYSCRAGTATEFCCGDEAGFLSEFAWYHENASGYNANSVGLKHPNPWGLYDMHGNVSEWCQDAYGAYTKELQVDPKGAAGDLHVFRGGYFFDGAAGCRSAHRNRNRGSHPQVGVRVALSLP